MGKFAFHFKAAAECTSSCNFTGLPYAFVDYEKLTDLANPSTDDGTFDAAWMEELSRANSNFSEHFRQMSGLVLGAALEENEANGEEGIDEENEESSIEDLSVAVKIVTKHKGRSFVVDLLDDIKALLECSNLNAEALLRAAKKRDRQLHEAGKKGPGIKVIKRLLPELYASVIYHATGTTSMTEELVLLREFLEDEDESNDKKETDAQEKSKPNAEAVREDEYLWFMEKSKGLSDKELGALVAHRGFHCEKDDSATRPVENSLSSFEYAWGAGVHLCECDVGATKDEKIIMAHDENFRRLALLSGMNETLSPVKELTLSEIMRMPLKHGARPPLLVDALRSAMAIGDHAKLVIEVKPGNSDIIDPLMNLFRRHPDLLSRVAVIMSFDTYVMQELADLFAVSNMFPSNMGAKVKSQGTLAGITEGKPENDSDTMGFRRTRMTTRQKRATRMRPMQSVSYGAISEISAPPKLLVLTAWKEYNLGYLTTGLADDFQGIKQNVIPGGGLDGVYMEYEPGMLEPEGREKMLQLAEMYTVGVWMLKPRDPDSLSVARRLVDECGVSYVNTDFPRGFFTS